MAGALLGLLSVLIGAFGAHIVKGTIAPNLYEALQTGVEYQSVHALALLWLSQYIGSDREGQLVWVGRFWLVGVILFSGSLYLLAITGVRLLGLVTPFGGTAMVIGWLLLFRHAWRCR